MKSAYPHPVKYFEHSSTSSCSVQDWKNVKSVEVHREKRFSRNYLSEIKNEGNTEKNYKIYVFKVKLSMAWII